MPGRGDSPPPRRLIFEARGQACSATSSPATSSPYLSVDWVRSTTVRIGDVEWFGSAADINLSARSAIVPLGPLPSENAQVFAFVSPFSSVSAAFKDGLASPSADMDHVEADPVLLFDIDGFVQASRQADPESIRGLEGRTSRGVFVSFVASDDAPSFSFEDFGDIHIFAVLINATGHAAKIHRDYHIELDDVSSPLEEASSSLKHIFEMTRAYVSAHRHTASSGIVNY